MRFVCVLKTGGDFDMEYVRKLAVGVRKHTSIDYTFTCLTDAKERDIEGVEFVDLIHDLPGWWSKIEVFQFTGECIYLDLDTVLTGNIDCLLRAVGNLSDGKAIMMLRGFKYQGCASGIMGWNGDLCFVLTDFTALRGKRFIQHSAALRLFCGNMRYRGDQDWLSECFLKRAITVTYAQDFMCGIYSYKNHELSHGLPDNAKVVLFHGHPRPHELPEAHSLREHWQ